MIRRIFRLPSSTSTVLRDVDSEIAFHIETRTDELVKGGATPEDAKASALLEFGSVTDARDDLRRIDDRRVARERRADWWSAFTHDAGYALRAMRRQPIFAATVIVTLALGIGANAAMFGVVDRLLFRPPAYMAHPGRMHRVYFSGITNGELHTVNYASYRLLRALDSTTTSAFERTAAFFGGELAVGTGLEAGERTVLGTSARFFEMFDAPPVVGRYFTISEDVVPIGAPVVVLSYGYWQSAFGGKRNVINETLKIGTDVFTIIGVAPRGFAEDFSRKPPLAFIPITRMARVIFGASANESPTDYFKTDSHNWTEMLVERRPNVTVDMASRALAESYRRDFARIGNESPGSPTLDQAKPTAIAGSILRERGPLHTRNSMVVVWLEGVAVVVLLIACANVANLLLARAMQRRREIAVRLALGISRKRLFTQLMIESVLLASFAGVAGFVVAEWGGAALRVAFLPGGEGTTSMFDMRVLAFTSVAAIVTGVLSGLVPALQVGRDNLTSSLKAGAREGAFYRTRTRTFLLVGQGALSVVLLVGAGLFVRSLLNVQALRLGYDVDPVLYVSAEMRGMPLTSPERGVLKERLLARAVTLPGVENATLTLTVPFWMNIGFDVFIPGVDPTAPWLGRVVGQIGSPSYFETTGTRILRGRAITKSDNRNSPLVIVVSESMAEAAWSGREALGQCVKIGADTNPCRNVVGIAENITGNTITERGGAHYYLPNDQYINGALGGLFVRVRGNGELQMEGVRRALQEIMPGTSYVTVVPMSRIVGPQLKSWQLGARMFGLFGLLALTVAAVGLYSVIAYGVTQRQRELGVRVALGAQTRQIVSLVLRQSLSLAVAGVAIGALLALGAGRWIKPLLFEVSPNDPLVFASVVGVLLVTALVASAIPAGRAARVDPNVALRGD